MMRQTNKYNVRTGASGRMVAAGQNFWGQNSWALIFSTVVVVGLLLWANVVGRADRHQSALRLNTTASNLSASKGSVQSGSATSSQSGSTSHVSQSPSPKSSQSSTQTSSQPSDAHDQSKFSCDHATAQAAQLLKQTQTAAENTYHQAQLTIIETTGALTRLLNPPLYAQEINQENSRHTERIQAIIQDFTAAMTAAHC